MTFAIYPDGESVSLGLFQRTIRDIQRLIIEIDYAVTKERGVRRWVISELHSSVPTITLTPLVDSEKLVETIIKGLGIVTVGTSEPPTYFTEQALEDLKHMRSLFTGRDRANRLEFSGDNTEKITIREDIGSKVDQIFRGGYWNLGSIEGTLEAINLHGNPTFTIWDRVGRAPIRCHFPKDRQWKDTIKGLLEKRALVAGRVNYFANGVPRSVTHIYSIEDTSPDPSLPKAAFGSIPSTEAASDSVQFLDRVRGERW